MKKHTKEYAEMLAIRNVAINQEDAFIKGFLMAVEENAVPELITSLKSFIGIYKDNPKVRKEINEFWIDQAERTLNKINQ